MNLKQLKEFLAVCKKHGVSEIVFGKTHVSFAGPLKPEQPDHVVIQALGQGIEEGYQDASENGKKEHR